MLHDPRIVNPMVTILVLPEEILPASVCGLRIVREVVAHIIKEDLIFNISLIKLCVVNIAFRTGPEAVDGERLFVPVMKTDAVALLVTLTKASEPRRGKYTGIWSMGIRD